jgi:hypothetical protein
MFGFSLPKIFLLIIIILFVWNFFKFIEKKSRKQKENSKFYKEEADIKEDEALIECDECGSFYSLNLEKKCPECNNK